MMKDYLLHHPLADAIVPGDEFDISGPDPEATYIVANTPDANAEIHAPEINLYLDNSRDPIRKKLENLKRLYRARAAAFDNSLAIEQSVPVGNSVLVITAQEQLPLAGLFENAGLSVMFSRPEQVRHLTGHIGNFRTTLDVEDEQRLILADQVVLLGNTGPAAKRKGIHHAPAACDTLLSEIKADCGSWSYTRYVSLDTARCLRHHKRTDMCGRCLTACPNGVIAYSRENKELTINHIDCSGCGYCVAVCPSGALEFGQMPRFSLASVAALYQGSIPLITAESDIDDLAIPDGLPENMLPLVLPSTGVLDESSLLTLIQSSGSHIVLFNPATSLVGEAAKLLNEVFTIRYGRKAVYLCRDSASLGTIPALDPKAENFAYEADERGLNKRERFSAGLSFLTGPNDLGRVTTPAHIDYGFVIVDTVRCTLCLSCAGACTSGALSVHPEDNSLRCKPSVCTQCGYCQESCPENCLELVHHTLELRPGYFQQEVVATDDLFRCIECGMEFAPAKSIEKIAALMKPVFGDDDLRVKTLYCCPACKARVMLESKQLNTSG